ncbi:hypothetical protein [Marinoscillum furvescens]|uniref:VWA domain-containing protein n=1 Tax=Marinoscillum furvescens DSM 4134 TaxID=1122208 RepID=A0A3D9L4I0_MARFU|nr:hypothetical protein [Marinoscillum furvescens]RED99837.1 hypothetical protein C7460_107120 [Marinoscillum furvescens DSM 4134]
MENSWYSLDVSPVWVFAAVLLAGGLSVLLYSKTSRPWGKKANILLGFLRLTGIFLILLLLLNPVLQLFINETTKPLVVLAVDNSESILMRNTNATANDINSWVLNLKEQLSSKHSVAVQPMSGHFSDSLTFDGKTSNISALLRQIENDYEDHNLSAIILASDGIYNQGQSPAFLTYNQPIYTLGLGDTIPPKDIAIRNVRNNQVAYQGNQFPVMVTLYQKGFTGEQITLTIKEGNQTLASKNLKLTAPIVETDFLLQANDAGFRRLTLICESLPGESSQENNVRDIYIDVIEGKDQILILAPAPHPDISALRQAIASASNYETSVFIPGLTEKPTLLKYDLIIEHQAFSGVNYGNFESDGKWYIFGPRTRASLTNQLADVVSIQTRGNKKDLVRGAYNTAFSKFELNEELVELFTTYPPIQAPFGTYQLSDIAEALLFQTIGSVTTDRPLMAFASRGGQKTAVTTGSGIWKWRLQEAATEEKAELFDELIVKTVQYLSIKENKDRFRVKPRDEQYTIGERVMIDTEVYSEIYERIYGNKITLTVTDDVGNASVHELVDSQGSSSFNLGSMPAGIYSYRASTTINGKPASRSGSFAVRDIQLENINLTANHNALKSISNKSGGQFFHFSERNGLLRELESANFQNLITTEKESFPLIRNWWIILIITFVFSAEWFMRKYLGAY